MAQRWCAGLFHPFEHANIRCGYLARLSSCAVAIRVNSVFARHCFDPIRELTPATVCWTRWNPATLNSSGTESCREITFFHVASWSGVPGQPLPHPHRRQSAWSWLSGGIHFNQVISRAHCCLPTQPAAPPSPPYPYKAPAGPLLQATREKPGPAFHPGPPPPVRAVMLIVPLWQHVARWMQLSGFFGGAIAARDEIDGDGQWWWWVSIVASQKKNKGVEHDSQANKRQEKWFRQIRDGLRGREWLFLSLTRSERFPFQIKKKKIGV